MTWLVIGGLGRARETAIPRILTAAVFNETTARVVAVDLADSTDELVGAQSMTRLEFDALLAHGEAFGLSVNHPWTPNEVVYVAEECIVPQILSVDAAEKQLREFVTASRVRGYAELRRDNQRKALQHFDLARQVTNEVDDYVRVCVLESPRYRAPWFDWLERYAPGLDLNESASLLKLVPSKAIFERPHVVGRSSASVSRNTLATRPRTVNVEP